MNNIISRARGFLATTGESRRTRSTARGSERTRRNLGVLSLAGITLIAASCGSGSTSSSTARAKGNNAAGSVADPNLTATLKGSGSTFQEKYLNASITTLSKVLPGVTISYAGGGSGQGKSDLADGVTNFAGTDSPVAESVVGDYPGGILYFPTVVAPITIAYRIDGVDKLNLDGPTLAGILTADIAKWDDPAIAAMNPDATLPSTPITVCRRADASGTTTNLSKYLDAAGGEAWTLGTGDALEWPSSTQGAAGNGGVAQCIDANPGSIGYVDLADAQAQDLTSASIKNRAGQFIAPTLQGATAAAARATINDDLTYSPIDVDGPGVYPLTSPTWVIVTAHQDDQATADALRAFLGFILGDGQDESFTASVHYAPIPAGLAAKARAQLESITVK